MSTSNIKSSACPFVIEEKSRFGSNRMRRFTWAVGLILMAKVSAAGMLMPGTFAVSPTGAATYTIPIQVPPGVNGMEPSVSLNYNSQIGNGLLGVGWRLGGMSAITRCPRTLVQDGEIGALTYTSTDRFCLDGEKLILMSGTYGVAGSVYHTENETFSQVTAFGASGGGGPEYFVVKTKSGHIKEYGRTADSQIQIEQTGSSVFHTWALSKVTDRSGNGISYSYIKDSYLGASEKTFNTGNYVPSQINYTWNSNTGLAATSTVKFTYDYIRPDGRYSYVSGYKRWERTRLTGISTETGGSTVLKYKLGYDESPGTGRSRLKSVSVCDASDRCLPSTTMGLSNEVLKLQIPFTGTTQYQFSGMWLPMDVNGDGKTDLANIHGDSICTSIGVYTSSGNGLFVGSGSGSIGCDKPGGIWKVLDANGDGLADLIHLTTDSGKANVFTSIGTGKFNWAKSFVTSEDVALTNGAWDVLDVDGDGLMDLVHRTTSAGDVRVWKSLGDGKFSITKFSSTSADAALTDGVWHVIDVNGDGLDDLVHLTTNSGDVRVWTSSGNGTFTINKLSVTADTSYTNGSWQVADINGDGLRDLIHLTTNAGDMRVWMSLGNGAFEVSAINNTTDTSLSTGTWQVADYNGDKLDDLIHLTNESGKIYSWKSKGDGTFDVAAFTTSVDKNLSTGLWLSGDFLGLGVSELLHLRQDTSTYYMWMLPHKGTDIPWEISKGTTGRPYVSWETNTLPQILTQEAAWAEYGYTMQARSVYPSAQSTVILPLRVVKRVFYDAGVDADNSTTQFSYFYDSARAERAGRGFLGFDSLYEWNYSIGRATKTHYLQTAPFLGRAWKTVQTVRPAGSAVSSSQSRELSTTLTNWNCITPLSKTACSVSPGNRYLVFPLDVEARSNDLDGSALPGMRTYYGDADGYGNIGSIKRCVLKPGANGAESDYCEKTTNTYAEPDLNRWIVDRLLTSTVINTGPDVPAPVVPGSGNLPAAPPPKLPKEALATLMIILETLLLSDD